MFENVVSEEGIKVIPQLSHVLKDFYLAGGTGLAVQLGHRISYDLDFFSEIPFDPEVFIKKINPTNIFFIERGTIHCQIRDIKLSLLYYPEPLIYPELPWHSIKIADWRDIAAEKIKAAAQRGAKKDFYDIYGILRLKTGIGTLCQLFNKRFADSRINRYHVLKSLVYFDDAEDEPNPIILIKEKSWDWNNIKQFFIENIREFERHLMP